MRVVENTAGRQKDFLFLTTIPHSDCWLWATQSALYAAAALMLFTTKRECKTRYILFLFSYNIKLRLFIFFYLCVALYSFSAALIPAEFNRSESCVRLESPPNGDLNCLSWTWGQMCRPSCSAGHVFFRPLPSAVYLCGRDRRWKPGTSVPDCARKCVHDDDHELS